jgi:hypothetical protein
MTHIANSADRDFKTNGCTFKGPSMGPSMGIPRNRDCHETPGSYTKSVQRPRDDLHALFPHWHFLFGDENPVLIEKREADPARLRNRGHHRFNRVPASVVLVNNRRRPLDNLFGGNHTQPVLV